MRKSRLMTPGPTPMPEPTRLELAKQVVHHRTAPFRQLMTEVLDGLKYVFQTENDVLVMASSGTGAMEAAVSNLVPRGGKIIALESGKFAERWRDIADVFGIEVVGHKIPWGQAFSASDVAKLLEEHPDAVAIYAPLSETSTGVGHDIEAIGRMVAPTDTLLVVDAISGVGPSECRTDAWGIDVLVVGSQKGLMAPAGLAMLAVSPAAWSRIESVDRQAFYFDLLKYRAALANPDTPFTPPEPLIAALGASLREIRSEGIETVWTRAKLLGRATRAGCEALGLRLVADRPADGLTAIYFPDGIQGKAFLDRLEARFGIRLAGGQGPLKGKAFRIAHMGHIDELDVISALAAIELVLVEMGQSVKLGCGVGAAQQVLAKAG